MRYDVLLECGDRPYPRHLATVYADDDDAARRLVEERWLLTELELRLRIVRIDGDRLTIVSRRRPDLLALLHRAAGFIQRANLEYVRIVPSFAKGGMAKDETEWLFLGEKTLLILHDEVVDLV